MTDLERQVNELAARYRAQCGTHAAVRQMQSECCHLAAAVNARLHHHAYPPEDFAKRIAWVIVRVGIVRHVLGPEVDAAVLNVVRELEETLSKADD